MGVRGWEDGGRAGSVSTERGKKLWRKGKGNSWEKKAPRRTGRSDVGGAWGRENERG